MQSFLVLLQRLRAADKPLCMRLVASDLDSDVEQADDRLAPAERW